MAMITSSPSHDGQAYADYFEDQVVFLTGGTGGLGGCLLYKLALKLPTRLIFVLCRESPAKAKARWRESMPAASRAILSSAKVLFVVGDMTAPNFGISKNILAKLASTVTIVIHAAASIALWDDLKDSIEDNCLPSLELARMASSFKNLRHFVQLSSAYCNGFLKDGLVEERFYDIGIDDLEEELDHIMTKGTSPHAESFPWPYAYGKYLMEQLLARRYPNLPLLIIRPTTIGPAVYQPFPQYGPAGSNPLSTFIHLILLGSGSATFRLLPGQATATNIFDEVPVDWVANLTLLHIAGGSRGPVHAGAESYIPRTFDNLLRAAKRANSKLKIVFTQDPNVKQSPLVEFYRIGTRDWRFSNMRSEKFRDVEGPLSIGVDTIDIDKLDRMRMEIIDAAIAATKRGSKI